jgi:predicted RNA binding protein YcfA (HicA-like mRNA interferase family)
MPKPKRLSGADVIKILEQFGFTIANQRGSHTKLFRLANGTKQILVVPKHKELKTGSVVGVFKQATAYIPESELRPHFYAD